MNQLLHRCFSGSLTCSAIVPCRPCMQEIVRAVLPAAMRGGGFDGSPEQATGFMDGFAEGWDRLHAAVESHPMVQPRVHVTDVSPEGLARLAERSAFGQAPPIAPYGASPQSVRDPYGASPSSMGTPWSPQAAPPPRSAPGFAPSWSQPQQAPQAQQGFGPFDPRGAFDPRGTTEPRPPGPIGPLPWQQPQSERSTQVEAPPQAPAPAPAPQSAREPQRATPSPSADGRRPLRPIVEAPRQPRHDPRAEARPGPAPRVEPRREHQKPPRHERRSAEARSPATEPRPERRPAPPPASREASAKPPPPKNVPAPGAPLTAADIASTASPVKPDKPTEPASPTDLNGRRI